ncbi:MAG: tRNA pseudouridine(55) synthase TruB [Corynebacteriales bacterium]|nr:tRNA pseudouridine(55) synthase TruB [Mycobacteriales bacterium]
MDGLTIVDKPAGWTSHDVVAKMRGIARTRKVGHAGTLDPMATGVLVLGVGKGTKLLGHLALTDKAYTATIRFGASTVTDDAEGERTGGADASELDAAAIAHAMADFTGDILQVPSAVSAIKINGERAYKRVRAGESVRLAARPVTVSHFELLTLSRPSSGLVDARVSVECSTGTYIRALARDLGERFGVGAHLTALRRTRVGPFTVEQARSLEQLAGFDEPVIFDLARAVRSAFEHRVVSDDHAASLRHGGFLPPVGMRGIYGVFDENGAVVALVQERKTKQGTISACPVVVLSV